MANVQSDTKLFVGGLSWNTTAEKLESYFSNFGQVLEAFVSYDRVTGRPRGFGFVIFEDPAVADRVASQQHTIDRREVEAKKAVPKEDNAGIRPQNGVSQAPQRTKKVFVGGLAPSVDELAFRQYFEQFGAVEDAVVMYDHDSKRPRGFGFVTFVLEDTVDQVFMAGPLQALHDKQIEIKRAVPRDQMPQPRGMVMMRPPVYGPYGSYAGGRPMYGGYGQTPSYPVQGQYGQPGGYGVAPYRGGGGGGMHAGIGAHISSSHMGMGPMSAGMGGGPGAGMPMGVLGGGGGLSNGAGMGVYPGAGSLAAGFAGGLGSPQHSLGLSMAGPMGSIGSLSGGGGYSLASAGPQSSFNMAALQGALPSTGRGGGEAAQQSAGSGSLGGGGAGLDGGYNGAQGLESYPAASGEGYSAAEGMYGSLAAQGPQGSSGLDTYAAGSAGDSYGVAGGLGAAGPGDPRDNAYSGGGGSPPIGNFSTDPSGFTASAQHAAAQHAAGQGQGAQPNAFMAHSSMPFNASLAVSSGLGPGSAAGLGNQASVSSAFGGLAANQASVSSAFSGLGANQASVSSAFSASSFTESPLAWS